MEEARDGMGAAGDYHDHNPSSHTLESVQNPATEVVVYIRISDFDDLRVLDQQEG